MRSEQFVFPNRTGEELSGRLELPDETPRAVALFAHCFTCSKNVKAASRISQALTQHGLAVLRFDFTGLGNSEGDFSNTNFSSNVSDIVAAANELRERYQAPALLVGHSLGGAAVLAAAPEVPEVRGVATIGAPSDPGHVTHLLEGKIDEIQQQGHATVTLAGRSFRIRRDFIEDLDDRSLTRSVGELAKALLIFHSPTDNTVGIDHARQLYQAAKHPKSFISLDRADHLLTDPDDAQFVADVLGAWARRFLAS